MIIAIDGPSGAGKSTLGKRLAKELGLLYLDTGAMYRAVALAVLEAGALPNDEEKAVKIAGNSKIELSGEPEHLHVWLDGRDVSGLIRTPEVSQAASIVSAIPAVRRILVEKQRLLGKRGAGCVLEGRDIGTVVFPDADIKFFITAKLEARTRRRYEELLQKGEQTSFEHTLAEINQRDERDATRTDSPLIVAENAVVIDSTEMSLDEVFELMLKLANKKTQRQVSDFTEIGGSPVSGFTLRQVLRGHTDLICRMAWSPDGSYLASPSSDNTIRIWDAHDGKCLRILQGHTDMIVSVAWSPDSQFLASASVDKTIRVWDAKSGKKLQTLKGHNLLVTSVAWSPDGLRLASASGDGTIRVWDAKSGKKLQILKGHNGQINEVAWSPDGLRLASAARDKTIRVWDAKRGEQLQTLKGHNNDDIISVAWSPDGQFLASASVDKTICLWEPTSGNALQVLEGHTGRLGTISFSSNGKWLASKSDGMTYEGDESVRLWRCDTWTCVVVLEETADINWFQGISFHPHLPILATLGENGRIIRIWELDEALLLGQAQKSFHYTTAKLVLVGDSGVGKTGLGWRLAHNEFKEHSSTHGQQFWTIPQLGIKRADGTECEAVLWDLAGQHIYRQIHSIFLENVAAALVLFDPSNRQDPLKGVQFWLEQLKGKGQLPPGVLVGARVDRGAPVLSQQELEQFCQRYGIPGGYISTSAFSGEGLDLLLETLKKQIPWDEMTATVTTVTFKRIKDYVLRLKEKPDREAVIVSPLSLRKQLQASDPDWRLTDEEM
ncbi:MAG TPA: (d)CMP kinase, partial [Pyrinomonadaceae bacterium]